MHPVFQVSLYTGQQLVLEAMQRWLRRPCAEPDQHRARRAKLKDLLLLLVKTAATGVVATILDAAIEYRRRQLLAAAAAEPDADDAGGARGFPGLGALSRAGVAAWKRRLLLCIDEAERQAEAYGFEPTRRFSPAGGADEAGTGDGKGKAGVGMARSASSADLTDDERAQMLATVEQLRGLVKQGDAEAERRLDEEVGCIIDALLGQAPASTPSGSDAPPSTSPHASGSSAGLAALPPSAGAPAKCDSDSSAACSRASCQICMDAPVKVAVAGCDHGLCFLCARRLCAGQDHLMPQCPFCRQPINGFHSLTAAQSLSQ